MTYDDLMCIFAEAKLSDGVLDIDYHKCAIMTDEDMDIDYEIGDRKFLAATIFYSCEDSSQTECVVWRFDGLRITIPTDQYQSIVPSCLKCKDNSYHYVTVTSTDDFPHMEVFDADFSEVYPLT